METSIGKNTLGGGKKMQVQLNNYNRSSHDLSFIFRSTMAPGVLVPSMKLLMLPGDTFNIKTRMHTLTHPTIGPLFGSFKQQNDFFFCPIRLYNAMLHNNALNIGLDMSQVKLPIISLNQLAFKSNMQNETEGFSRFLTGSNETLLNNINPSSLPAYLGYKCTLKNLNIQSPGGIDTWQAVPLIAYFDIFKNYYANKQEENFYTVSGIGGLEWLGTSQGGWNIGYSVGGEGIGYGTNENPVTLRYAQVAAGSWAYINIIFEGLANEWDIVSNFYIDITILGTAGESSTQRAHYATTLGQLYNSGNVDYYNDTTNDRMAVYFKSIVIADPETYAGEGTPVTEVTVTVDALENMETMYRSYPLADIDTMRENILAAGRNQYEVTENFITDIFNTENSEMGYSNARGAMAGLALKTYQSDINTNWINTDWIDGDNGINAITAVDTSGGSFTIDQLNLASKVYRMLNRIAVSDGSYNAWIQTVYTSGGLNHIETPLYIGGSSQEIEFQEVINNSGTEEEPLGTLAGRGFATNKQGGEIHFKADEPGYIICITSITPRVDYFQGNDWDCYLETMDDLHKPQLDGIGFQDRLYRNMNAQYINDLNTSIGKQPAWIEYMTNVNKTFGNFALMDNEGWMCINRIFEGIDTYTTYVQPHLYNSVFADTSITAQNFWVQIAFDIEARRVMSAKQIPNL